MTGGRAWPHCSVGQYENAFGAAPTISPPASARTFRPAAHTSGRQQNYAHHSSNNSVILTVVATACHRPGLQASWSLGYWKQGVIYLRCASKYALALGASPAHVARACIQLLSSGLAAVGTAFESLSPAEQAAVTSDHNRLWAAFENIAAYANDYRQNGLDPAVFTAPLGAMLNYCPQWPPTTLEADAPPMKSPVPLQTQSEEYQSHMSQQNNDYGGSSGLLRPLGSTSLVPSPQYRPSSPRSLLCLLGSASLGPQYRPSSPSSLLYTASPHYCLSNPLRQLGLASLDPQYRPSSPAREPVTNFTQPYGQPASPVQPITPPQDPRTHVKNPGGGVPQNSTPSPVQLETTACRWQPTC